MYICLLFNLNFLCASVVTTFLVLTHCLHYCMALFSYGDNGAKGVGPNCCSFKAIAWQQLHLWCKQGLLYVATVFVCFVVRLFALFLIFIVCVFLFIYFLRDSNMISISTVEFRYYVVIIVLVNLGKPSLSYTGLNQLRLISFQWTSEPEAGLWISDLDFHCKPFAFCLLYCQNFWSRMS